jgi:GDP-L-fucose synthase
MPISRTWPSKKDRDMTDTAAPYSLDGKRVWVAGHGGLVGSALVKRLASEHCELVSVGRSQLDLRRQSDVEDWLAETRPAAIFVAAATVGGIHANDVRPADFLYDNVMIEANIIHAAWRVGVEKLLFLGSTCIYPKFAPQPMAEDDLMTGPLEPTNQWYALAKIAGIYLCQAYRRQHGSNFISAMPTNLFGPGDYFDAENSHVIPALMGKIHRAREENIADVDIWGSGEPYREFLYSEDAADALVFLMKHYTGASHINVGTGDELKIIEIARLIADIVGYRGAWKFDTSRQDGPPRKLADSRLLNTLGWTPRVGLRDGLQATYDWFRESYAAGQLRV